MSLLAVLASASLVCAASVVVGQAVWRLAGFQGWSWLAAPVGLATLVALAGPATALPGAGVAGAVALLAVTLVALAFRPHGVTRGHSGETALVAGLGLFVACLPFIAAGRVGILGVGDNPDFYGHLMRAEALRTGDPAVGLDPAWYANYPTGPHSLAASLAAGLGIPVDAAFVGLLLSILVVSVLTALSVLRAASLPRRVVAALIAGVPYLAASYTVQASFKETFFGVIVVAWALALHPVAAALRSGARALVPLLALAAGGYAVYGFVAFAWLGAVTLVSAVAAALLAGRVRGVDRRALIVGAGATAIAVLALVAIAQLPQAKALIENVKDIAGGNSTGGNIRAELPFYEVFGAWPNVDLRVVGGAMLVPRALALLAGAATLWAAVWWIRRRVELPAVAGVTLAIYAFARATASPYYSAKALAIASFAVVLMTTAALALALPAPRRLRESWWAAAAATTGIVVLAACAWSSALVLRGARVAPSEHSDELASLRPLLRASATLYTGQNDYIPWILRGVKVGLPFISLGRSQIELVQRPEKPWNNKLPFDFDDVDPAALDRFRFVVAPRTPYTSAAPPNWRRIRVTSSYVVWKRNGPTAMRSVLRESGAPGAVLNCDSPLGHRRGSAAVRTVPVVVAPSRLRLPDGRPLAAAQFDRVQIAAGGHALTRVGLPRGRWTVSLQYVSPVPVEVRADAGPAIAAPPSLDGPGAFWRVGDVTSRGAITVDIHPRAAPPLAAAETVLLGSLAFTRSGDRDRVVPLRAACGRYVDWYRTA